MICSRKAKGKSRSESRKNKKVCESQKGYTKSTPFKFKEAVSHIGCMNKDDWLEVEEIERCNEFQGVALSSGTGDDSDHFIVIQQVQQPSTQHMDPTLKRLADPLSDT